MTKAGILAVCTTLLVACSQAITSPEEIPSSTPAAHMIEKTAMPTSPSLGTTWIRPGGALMIYVPAGEFEMGSDDDDVDYAM
jgi:hypothetical protein